jgi:hypothetical protein
MPAPEGFTPFERSSGFLDLIGPLLWRPTDDGPEFDDRRLVHASAVFANAGA